MNAYVNYLVEANIGLLISLLFYIVFLHKETAFNFKRLFLLTGILASLVFPLIKIQLGSHAIPSIGEAMSTYFLPELVVGNQAEPTSTSVFNYWILAKWIYLSISTFLLIGLIIKVNRIRIFLNTSRSVLVNGKFRIIESSVDLPTFSFFRYIFIGNISSFSPEEREQIIQHEVTHATKLHSLDMLLLELLKIVFWFNPGVYYLKSLLTSIHEFQADQLAVDNRDVNQYCNLLARVALQSADYPIANHFNNSLTLKRIAMMKTAKTKLSRWKMATVAPLLIGLFVLIACQEQVMNDIQKVVDNSTMAGSMPEDIKNKLEQLQKANPSKGYVVLELNEEGKKTFEKLKAEHYNDVYSSKTVIYADKNGSEDSRFFTILEKGERTQQLSDFTKTDGEVFTIVEEPASPTGGIGEFYKLIAQQMKYPLEARQKGLEGKVFIEFTVNTDGTLSDIRSVKGIGKVCDEEATRVVSLSPPWVPAKQKGKLVRQRMVLPITFMLGNSDTKADDGKAVESNMNEMVVKGLPPKEN